MLKKIDPNSTSHLTNPSHLKVHLTVVAAQDLNLITRVWKRPRAAVVNVTDAKEKMRSRSIKSEESVLEGHQGMDGRVKTDTGLSFRSRQ